MSRHNEAMRQHVESMEKKHKKPYALMKETREGRPTR
jgi:flagellar motor component MotA